MKPDLLSRRDFVRRSTVIGASVAGATAAQLASCGAADRPPASARSRSPKRLLGGTATLSEPSLAPSPLSFRIGLARTRTAAYPMNSMDFILTDLERPAGRSRHAHWCTGDLTGRLLEFLSCSDAIDGTHDPRLPMLLDRILKQRALRFSPMCYNTSPAQSAIAAQNPTRAATPYAGCHGFKDVQRIGDTSLCMAAS
jgi:hypothetical protein